MVQPPGQRFDVQPLQGNGSAATGSRPSTDRQAMREESERRVQGMDTCAFVLEERVTRSAGKRAEGGVYCGQTREGARVVFTCTIYSRNVWYVSMGNGRGRKDSQMVLGQGRVSRTCELDSNRCMHRPS